ncbi:hypothetical protein GQ42DRAFT_156948 [Ramicandelaber brevisporus]|nr:hypothetical protein GQ42DRAFT_156948 [Ramicandelaber brevisporus]
MNNTSPTLKRLRQDADQSGVTTNITTNTVATATVNNLATSRLVWSFDWSRYLRQIQQQLPTSSAAQLQQHQQQQQHHNQHSGDKHDQLTAIGIADGSDAVVLATMAGELLVTSLDINDNSNDSSSNSSTSLPAQRRQLRALPISHLIVRPHLHQANDINQVTDGQHSHHMDIDDHSTVNNTTANVADNVSSPHQLDALYGYEAAAVSSDGLTTIVSGSGEIDSWNAGTMVTCISSSFTSCAPSPSAVSSASYRSFVVGTSNGTVTCIATPGSHSTLWTKNIAVLAPQQQQQQQQFMYQQMSQVSSGQQTNPIACVSHYTTLDVNGNVSQYVCAVEAGSVFVSLLAANTGRLITRLPMPSAVTAMCAVPLSVSEAAGDILAVACADNALYAVIGLRVVRLTALDFTVTHLAHLQPSSSFGECAVVVGGHSPDLQIISIKVILPRMQQQQQQQQQHELHKLSLAVLSDETTQINCALHDTITLSDWPISIGTAPNTRRIATVLSNGTAQVYQV